MRWKIARKCLRSVTVDTRHGKLTVDTRDRYIAKSLYCKREYEIDLMLQTTAHLRACGLLPEKGRGTVLDIGANMGVSSVGFLYNHEFERAVAVEPDPRNFDLLKRNMQQNGFGERSLCLQYALSDRAGKLEFELSESNFGDHRVRVAGAGADKADLYQEKGRRVIEVETVTLDALLQSLPGAFRDSLALVWMDVQGFEGFVYRGGRGIFASPIPVATEIWPYGIRRAGMTREEFCDIIRSTWPHYWMLRGQRKKKHFVKYPTSIFDTVFDEIGFEGAYENVLLTHS
ncbi:MAG: FkbM family methyltransferase [Planctomycetes bacterium]|nr:FkbM family methyltransferase [Planctomycetota bacterium]